MTDFIGEGAFPSAVRRTRNPVNLLDGLITADLRSESSESTHRRHFDILSLLE